MLYYFCIKNAPIFTISDYIRAVIVIVYVEETFFRRDLPVLFANFQYKDYFISIVFGLIHLFNISLHVLPVVATIWQSINAILWGYYISQMRNFYHSLLFHMCYNCCVAVIQIYLVQIHNLITSKTNTEVVYIRKQRNSFPTIDLEKNISEKIELSTSRYQEDLNMTDKINKYLSIKY